MSPWPVMKMIGMWMFDVAQFELKIEAAQARHPHVEHQTGRRIRALRSQEILRRSERLHAKAHGPDEALHPSRISRSSSMTNTIGSGSFMRQGRSALGKVN